MTESIILERVRQKEKEDIRKLEMDIDNIKKKQLIVLEDRIKKFEDETEKMVYDKVEIQQKIMDEEQKKEALDKQFENVLMEFHQLKIDHDVAKMKNEEF